MPIKEKPSWIQKSINDNANYYTKSVLANSHNLANINRSNFKKTEDMINQTLTKKDFTPSQDKKKCVDFNIEVKQRNNYEIINRSPYEKINIQRNKSEGVSSRKKQDLFYQENNFNNNIGLNHNDLIIPTSHSPSIQSNITKPDFTSRRSGKNVFNDSKGSSSDLNDSKNESQNNPNKVLDTNQFNMKNCNSPKIHSYGFHNNNINSYNQSNINNDYDSTNQKSNNNNILFGMASRRVKANLNNNANNISSIIYDSQNAIFM